MSGYIRPAAPGDLPFVFETWLRCAQRSFRWLPPGAFFRLYRRVMEDLLKKPTTKLEVLSPVNCPPLIEGWICHEQLAAIPVVHFVFVKQEYRQMGRGHVLVEAALNGLPWGWASNWTEYSGPRLKKLRYKPALFGGSITNPEKKGIPHESEESGHEVPDDGRQGHRGQGHRAPARARGDVGGRPGGDGQAEG